MWKAFVRWWRSRHQTEDVVRHDERTEPAFAIVAWKPQIANVPLALMYMQAAKSWLSQGKHQLDVGHHDKAAHAYQQAQAEIKKAGARLPTNKSTVFNAVSVGLHSMLTDPPTYTAARYHVMIGKLEAYNECVTAHLRSSRVQKRVGHRKSNGTHTITTWLTFIGAGDPSFLGKARARR